LEWPENEVIKYIEDMHKNCEQYSQDHLQGSFPLSSSTASELFHKDYDPLKIKISCIWQYYRDRYEASIVNGSYSFSDKTFKGEQIGPVVDTKNPPGEHWTLLEKIPDNLGTNNIVMSLSGGNIKEALLAIRKSEITIELN